MPLQSSPLPPSMRQSTGSISSQEYFTCNEGSFETTGTRNNSSNSVINNSGTIGGTNDRQTNCSNFGSSYNNTNNTNKINCTRSLSYCQNRHQEPHPSWLVQHQEHTGPVGSSGSSAAAARVRSLVSSIRARSSLTRSESLEIERESELHHVENVNSGIQYINKDSSYSNARSTNGANANPYANANAYTGSYARAYKIYESANDDSYKNTTQYVSNRNSGNSSSNSSKSFHLLKTSFDPPGSTSNPDHASNDLPRNPGNAPTSNNFGNSSNNTSNNISKNTSNNPINPNNNLAKTVHSTHAPYHIHQRKYKGFSTPFCGMFQFSGGTSVGIAHDHKPIKNEEMHHHHHEQHQQEIATSNLRTDLCTLTLFGLLQSDQTRHLFTHTRPPLFIKRVAVHILIPSAIFLFAGWCAGNIRDDYVNSVVCTTLVWCMCLWIICGCLRGRKKRVMVREEILWGLARRDERRKRRLAEMGKGGGLGRLGGGHGHGDGASMDDDDEYEYYSEDEEGYDPAIPILVGQSRWEMNCAHRMFGCYPSDISRDSSSNLSADKASKNNDSQDGNTGDSSDYVLQSNNEDSYMNLTNGDLFTQIWNMFSSPCLRCIPCGNGSYGCHLQFCGLCALAQEAREANISLPRYYRMADYITMEHFLVYYPRILELRQRGNRDNSTTFIEHCHALSSLSTMLLQAWLIILGALLTLSLIDVVRYLQLSDVLVLLATFLQSFFVLYCVHWGWHRYDLSVDAVVKYFSCGFVLCTGMAFFAELVESLGLKLMIMSVVWGLGVKEVEDQGFGGGGLSGMKVKGDEWGNVYHRLLSSIGYEDERVVDYGDYKGYSRSLAEEDNILQGFFDRHPGALVLYLLIASYLMAGMVEEVCKYFGFVMVDHPDFCSERELVKAKTAIPLQLFRGEADDDDDSAASHAKEQSKHNAPSAASSLKLSTPAEENPLISFDPSKQRRSLSSIRAGVTVAFVAVALGFACCENLLYIFVYNRSSLASEIATLVIRSLFPVHPIAAAIQSIHLCRRDLENDKSIGVGRIIFSSAIFHGTYDFLLLLISHSRSDSQKKNYFYIGGDNGLAVVVLSFTASCAVVFSGFLYYLVRSRAQYIRLQAMSERFSSVRSVGDFASVT